MLSHALWTPLIILTVVGGLDQTQALFLTPYFLSLGLSGSWIGLLLGMFRFSTLLFVLPAGYLADRLSLRRLVLSGLAGLLLFYGGLQLFSHPWALLPLMALGGAGSAIVVIATTALFYKNMPPDNPAPIGTLNLSRSLIQGIITISGGALILWASFAGMFGVSFLLLLPLLLVAWKIRRQSQYEIPAHHYLEQLKSRQTLWIVLIYLVFVFHAGADYITAPTYWTETLRLNDFQIGLLGGLPIALLGVGVSLFSVKQLQGKASFRHQMAFWGLLLSGIGHLWIAAASSFEFSMLARSLHLSGDILIEMFLYTELSRLFPKESIGGQFSVFYVLQNLVVTLSIVAAGLVRDWWPGISFLDLTGGGMILASIVIALWRSSRPKLAPRMS